MTTEKLINVETPGFYIKDELEARNWSQTDLAYILGISLQQLNPILSGKHAISADMAVLLGDAFGMPAEFFANLDKNYRLSRAKAATPDIKKKAAWQTVYPIREMLKRGWIEEKDPALLDVQMLRFFEKDKIESVPYMEGRTPDIAYAARKTHPNIPTAAELAWLYRVRQIAKSIAFPPYSKNKLIAKIDELTLLLNLREGVASVAGILMECGVIFLIVETLPKAKIDGVCTWINDHPVIAITNRFDRLDNFWFVLRHEIEHVLREHGKESGHATIDNLEGENGSPIANIADEERVANAAAADFCVPSNQLESFLARKSPYISEKDVIGFAGRLEVHPSIVVGQIQYATQQWSFLRKYLAAAVCGVRDLLISTLGKKNIVDGWGCVVQTHL
jgi:HTH-type transcriptional regulator/antitoxin HigA